MSFPGFRDPVRDQQVMATIQRAVDASDFPTAFDMAQKALASGMVHPQLYNLRANWYEQQGKSAEALADIKRMLTLARDKVSAYTAYGQMMEKLNRRHDAVDAFRMAHALAPNSAFTNFNLGWGELINGSLKKAMQSLERALEIEPDMHDAMIHLTDLAYRTGDHERAKALGARILAKHPTEYDTITTMARVAIEQNELAVAEALLDRVPDKDAPAPLFSAGLYGALGDLRHAQGRYAEAFTAYTSANEKKLSVYGPKYDREGKETTISHLNWLVDYFEHAPAKLWAADPTPKPAQWSGTIPEPDQHVFLVGFPRSGTTLLENILAANPDVASLDEKEMMSDAFQFFMTSARGRDRLAEGRPEDLRKYRDQYWERVHEQGLDVTGKMFVDKHPLISMRLMVVAKLFPNAKILFAVRDPRDVVLSCYRRSFNMNFSMFPFLRLETAATFYDGVMKLSKIEHEKLGLDWHYLRHEALVENFDAEVGKACAFLGLEWNDEMRNFAERAKKRHIATPSGLQVMGGLSNSGVGLWRNYKDQLAPILPVLAPWVKAYGYEPD